MTHPPGNPPSDPKPQTPAPTGPGRLSDRALNRIFTALPVGLGVVLAIAAIFGGAR